MAIFGHFPRWLAQNVTMSTKNGQTFQIRSKMANLPIVDHLGPCLVYLDHFCPFQAKVGLHSKAVRPWSTLRFRDKKLKSPNGPM